MMNPVETVIAQAVRYAEQRKAVIAKIQTIEAEIATLHEERADLIKNLNAFNGAIEACQQLASQLATPEPETPAAADPPPPQSCPLTSDP
jgi:chromosome segregation ATPase